MFLPPALNVPTETGRQVRARGEGHYKPKWLRLAGVASVILTASVLGAVNYTEAGTYLAHNLPHFNKLFPDNQAALSEAPSIFTKRWYNTFKDTQGVDDSPRAGRPHKIPDKSGKQAAEILAQGYKVTYTVRGRQVEELKHFSTMSEAVHASDILRNMLAEFEATPEQMLEAIHRVAPELKHRRLTFRHSLSAAEKEKRQRVGRDLLARHQMDPRFLDRLVFIDETTIQTHGLKHDHIQVWVNSSDTSFKDYHGVPGNAWTPVRAHVIAAVTSHPAFEAVGGLVYMDFTTGTTNIKRRINRRLDGSQHVPDFKYNVGVLPLLNLHNTTWRDRQFQAGAIPHKGLGVRLHLALVGHPLSSIARAQHNPNKTLGSSQGVGHSMVTAQICLMHPDHSCTVGHSSPYLLKVSTQHLITLVFVHVCPMA